MRQLKIEFPIQVPNTQINKEAEPTFKFTDFDHNISPDLIIKEIYRCMDFFKNTKRSRDALFEDVLAKACNLYSKKLKTNTGIPIYEFQLIARKAWATESKKYIN